MKPMTISNYENITMIIFSCGLFSDLWDNQIFLLNKYWPKHPPYHIVTDDVGKYGETFVKDLFIIKQEQSDRLIAAIKQCSSDYIFLTLDDYFIKQNVDDSKITNILSFLDTNDLDYCRLFRKTKLKHPIIDKTTGYRYLNFSNDVYEVNLYPGIWKKDSLLKVLSPSETIWQTEVLMTKRFKNSGLKGIAVYDKTIYPFEDIVRKGKYLRKAYRFLRKNHLFISDRKVRTRREEFRLWCRTILSDNLPKGLKKRLKAFGRKRGKEYYSDYLDEDGKNS